MKRHPNTCLRWFFLLPIATLVAAGLALSLLLENASTLRPPPAPTIDPIPVFLSNLVTVEIHATDPNSEIYTTVNGSLPSRAAGKRYDAPLKITSTTILRAGSVRPWIANSDIATASYLFPAQTAWQSEEPPGFPAIWKGNHLGLDASVSIASDYGMDSKAVADPLDYETAVEKALRSLRTISLSAALPDLFDLETGIYVNANQRGSAWERPVSIELFEKDGQRAFQADAGLRVHGLASRRININPKQGMRIIFRKKYGQGKLHFPFFSATRKAGFDTLILRNLTQDSWIAQGRHGFAPPHYIRDEFARESHRAMGHPAIRGEFVHLYLNGLYWGIYNVCEPVDGTFLSDTFGGSELEFDILKGNLIDHGTSDAWNRVKVLSARQNNEEAYMAMEGLVDFTSLIDYVLVNQFVDNIDWFAGNSLIARKREPGGKFVFFVYDAEVAFNAREPEFDFLDLGLVGRRYRRFSPMHLFHKLQLYPEFKLIVADRIQHHYFNSGALTVENARQRWQKLAQSLDTAIVAEAARWGDCNDDGITYTREANWRPSIAQVRDNFFPERTALLLEHYRSQGLFPPLPAPDIYPRSGPVAGGIQVSMPEGNAEIYVTLDGTDPRVAGGAINRASAMRYVEPIDIVPPCRLKARAWDGTMWSALAFVDFETVPEAVN